MSSWSTLVKKLNSLPRAKNLSSMDVKSLPKMSDDLLEEVQPGCEFAEELADEFTDVPELRGELYFTVQVGQDVVVYNGIEDSEQTNDRRPWVGRAIAIYPEDHQFDIQWMRRVGRTNRYMLMYNGEEPYVDRVDEDSVMFTNMRVSN